jgi:heat shock protein HslJ
MLSAILLLAGPGCSALHQNDDGTRSKKNYDEAEPGGMALTSKDWTWLRTVYNNDTIIKPAKPGVFTLRFETGGTLRATTDCNRMGGSYSADSRKLSFSGLMATRMYCPDSQEEEFADMLKQVSSFLFTPEGKLVLELKFDSGHMLFK